ncbi:MAG: SNF2-related protein [Bacteroidales bacterium]
MSNTIADRIENYLNIYATSDVIKRGKILLVDKKIESAEINESNGTAHFKIRGTSLYSVSVTGINQYIQSDCNCPYNWGPVCKHQVAALFFLFDKFGGTRKEIKAMKRSEFENIVPVKPNSIKKTPPANPPLRTTLSPFIIADFKIITKEFIDRFRPKYSNDEFWGNHETILFEENKLHFLLNDSNYYYSPEFIIKFWHTPEGLNTVCSCGRKVKVFCKHQLFLLSKIGNSQHPDIFNLLLPENLLNIKKEILEIYGLNGGKFEDYLKLAYTNFEIDWILKESYKFLIPIKGSETHEKQFEEGLKKLDSDLFRIEIPNPISQKAEKRYPGFAIRVYPTFDLLMNDEVKIIGICGKENKPKTKLVSHIKSITELDLNERLVLNNEQKNLLEKISFFETKKEIIRFTENDENYIEKQVMIFGFLKEILPLLANEKYVFIYTQNNDYIPIRKSNLVPIEISFDNPILEFDITENDQLLQLTPLIKLDGKCFPLENSDKTNSHFLFNCVDNTLYLNKSISQSVLISQFAEGKLAMVKSEADRFFDKYIKPLSKHCKINFKTNLFTYKEIVPKPLKKQVYLSEHNEYILFKPIVEYENNIHVYAGSDGDILNKDSKNNIVRYIRNEDYENEFLEFIVGLHPQFVIQKHSGILNLEAESLLEDFWFFDAFEKMEKSGIEVFGLKDLKSFKYTPYHAKVSAGLKSGQDWFEVEIDVAFGDNSIDLKSIKKAVLNQNKYIRLADGSIGILPDEWLKKLESYFRAGEIKDEKLQISKLKFSIIDELFQDIDDAKIVKEIAEKRRKLKNIKNIRNIRKPKEITADLRSYQKEGLNWLNLLHEMGWGGILADDMGLGKTLQILTFLQNQVKKSKKTNLIIVPSTLLFNWEIELKKFAPSLTFHFYYGLNRDKEIKYFTGYDLVFTTYGVLVRDVEFLRNFQFNYIVLDESQAIKNPTSLRYKAAFLLQAEHKLTLTGTPIENSTFDLFAQMNFVNPGFLGSLNSFKEIYSKAIDKEGNQEVSKELNKMISPFVLRRTKEQVAKDLPEKTENILFCEMGNEQRKVYDAYRNKYRDKLLNRIKNDGLEKSKIFVLEGLMKLRQICDSPALLSDEEYYGHQSVKIIELVRHISEKTANHKILVFSQFVKMLKLIKEELVREKISIEYLEGQSSKTQREESVNHFQEDGGCRVFLISLKAGGVGLNLTAADYVYLMVDPGGTRRWKTRPLTVHTGSDRKKKFLPTV